MVQFISQATTGGKRRGKKKSTATKKKATKKHSRGETGDLRFSFSTGLPGKLSRFNVKCITIFELRALKPLEPPSQHLKPRSRKNSLPLIRIRPVFYLWPPDPL